MNKVDSRTAIYCLEYLHKLNAPNSFPTLVQDQLDDVVQEFIKLGHSHESKVLAFLKETIPNAVFIDPDLGQVSIEMETVAAILNPQIEMISGAFLHNLVEQELSKEFGTSLNKNIRASKPDLMVRVGTRSDGHPAWAPVDIKSHNPIIDNKSNRVYRTILPKLLPGEGTQEDGRLDYDDLHQLAHYTRHLQNLQIASDELWTGIIGRNIEEIVWTTISDVVVGKGKNQESFLDIHDRKFERAVEVIRLSIAENSDKSVNSGVLPANISGKNGCTVCSFKSSCLREMHEFDNGNGHVTLLARITPLVVENYFPEVQSIRDLRELVPQNDEMEEAQIRARVWKTRIPELLNPLEEFSLPEADIEIDIDLENSMEALRELELDEPIGEDRLYLYGYGIHDRTQNKDWHSAKIETIYDYSNTSDGEFKVMSQMWNILQSEIKKAEISGKSIKIFHYSPHEFTWWRHFSKRFGDLPGVPTLAELEDFKSKYLVDLYHYALKISFPTMRYSIKDLAKFIGFEWEVEKAGGAASLFKYRDAINQNLPKAERDAAIAWLDSYNRDDVRATFAVRDFIRKLNFV